MEGIILTGGKSSRMGTDKMAIKFNGITFLENAVNALSVFENIYISANLSQSTHPLIQKVLKDGVVLSIDKYDSIGPIGGLASTLPMIATNYAFVCACDMPFLTQDFIKSIIPPNDNQAYDAYILVSNNQNEPLCSIYSKSCIPIIEECIAQKKYGLNYMISKCNVKYIY